MYGSEFLKTATRHTVHMMYWLNFAFDRSDEYIIKDVMAKKRKQRVYKENVQKAFLVRNNVAKGLLIRIPCNLKLQCSIT